MIKGGLIVLCSSETVGEVEKGLNLHDSVVRFAKVSVKSEVLEVARGEHCPLIPPMGEVDDFRSCSIARWICTVDRNEDRN